MAVAFEWQEGAQVWVLYVFAIDADGVHASGSYVLSKNPPFQYHKLRPRHSTTLQATTIEEAKTCLEVIARMA